ncbi:MAG: hypothetical protein SX243_00440 [Acidobacteriota bacterium]|nr:hypothetical protein [Acidobacteriota bacterium]
MFLRYLFLGLILLSASGLLSHPPVVAQEEGATIQIISFENIPENVTVVGGGEITLDGPTAVTQGLVADGILETTSGGVRFPDGTLQTTAAATGGSQTANSGIYNNRIQDFTPAEPYTEICLKAGAIQADIHTISEPPTGGNCDVGDLGWVIERDERTATTWETAKATCLLLGMRLPETFEWRLSCLNATSFGISNMTGNWEWGSNTAAVVISSSGNSGPAVEAYGNASCNNSMFSWVASTVNSAESRAFRCLL